MTSSEQVFWRSFMSEQLSSLEEVQTAVQRCCCLNSCSYYHWSEHHSITPIWLKIFRFEEGFLPYDWRINNNYKYDILMLWSHIHAEHLFKLNTTMSIWYNIDKICIMFTIVSFGLDSLEMQLDVKSGCGNGHILNYQLFAKYWASTLWWLEP